MKIKVKQIAEGCFPKFIDKGEWIDLRSSITVDLKASQSGTLKKSKEGNYRDVTTEVTYIPLGIAMELPDGFEAIVAPRSSTPKKFGVMCANSFGIIDNSYCGDADEWKFPVIPLRNTTIYYGDRICQFRIQLSQKANFFQKLKWFFSHRIKFVKVNNLNNKNRGGLGSTGIK